MAGVTSALIGGGAAIGSALLGNKASKDAQKAQQQALAAQQTELNPFTFLGPGGQIATSSPQISPLLQGFQPSVSFQDLAGVGGQAGGGAPAGQAGGPSFLRRPDGTPLGDAGRPLGGLEALQSTTGLPQGLGGEISGQGIGISLGDLEPSRQGLVQLAQQQIGRAGLQGVPQEVLQAAQQAGGFFAPGADPLLNVLQGGALGQFGQTAGLLNQRRAEAAGGFEDFRNQQLGLLREQAAPFEQRAFQDLQENQFATGRSGTSGGGLQTEAFARGLGQNDLARQLAASGEARQQQGLSDQLLQSAFGQFQGLGGLTADLGQQRFGQGLAGAGFNAGQAQQNFGNQLSLAGLAPALQSAQLQPALQALQAQGALNQQGLGNFQAQLAQAQAQANARIGAGSNIANVVGGANFNPGAQSDFLGSLLGGVAQNRNQIAGALGGLFGGGGGQQGLQEINTSFIPRRI